MSTPYFRFRSFGPFLLAAFMLALGGCTSMQSTSESRAWADAEQMIVVVTPDWNAPNGELRRYERAGRSEAWRQVGETTPAAISRSEVTTSLFAVSTRGREPRRSCLARLTATVASRNRFSTISRQSSTVTLAIALP